MKALFLALCVLLAGISFVSPAMAATATTYMRVMLRVDPAAVVSVTDMDFGLTMPGDRNIQSAATLTVTVTENLPYRISLDYGQNFDGNWRRMASGNRYLQYGLYQDASRNIQWGDADTAGTYPYGISVSGAGTGSQQQFTVYGLAFFVEETGEYNDVVTTTVNY